MRRLIFIVLSFFWILPLQNAIAAYSSYAQKLCHSSLNVPCFVVHKGDTWASLWPDSDERALAMRINRMNIPLYAGLQLVDPVDMSQADLDNLQPFPQNIGSLPERTIVVSPHNLAWAAYDTDGNIMRWGAASTARGFCSDMDAKCTTPRGEFTIYRKEGEDCISSKFPIPDGGAPMPYCMYFQGGFAVHGSYEVPGFNASHGCVRIFPNDAQWLNQDFITVGETKVIVKDD